jgi:SEC-C motif-containing protein
VKVTAGRPGSGAAPCPCGSKLEFSSCCGRYIEDGQPAPDAESLMRSRYSAYVVGARDYLLATWHPSTRPADLQLDAGARWLGLDVRKASHAEVEFVARYRVAGAAAAAGAGQAVRIHERSRFVREDGRWYYVDGDLLTRA